MIGRADVERAIVDQEAFLEGVARLLDNRTELAAWTEDVRATLALALGDDSMSRTEGWKAVTLRRHLFGPSGVPPAGITAVPRQPSAVERTRAERLRSGAASARQVSRWRVPPATGFVIGTVSSSGGADGT